MNKKILTQVNKSFKNDGIHDTFLNDIKVYKTSKYDPLSPFIYDVCLILVLQGKKIAHLSENTLVYDSKNYLVVPTTLPLECETYASRDEPFIGLIISIDKKVMYEIIDSLSMKNTTESKKNSLGVFSDSVNNNIEELTLRLLKMLESKEESKILGTSILRELFYRIAVGENSDFLHKMFLHSNNEAKIARALKIIHTECETNLDIPNLARQEDMSVSSFHTHFKNITSHTPLQYIKKIRLSKAKDLIAKHHYQVVDAADEMGYDSASQFSRDFKNYFGYSPKEVKPSLKEYHALKHS
ncbi:AraC family transcriptional regulator [Sulfurimonas sp.]|uniref:AraC family transcriptional regulator n=1 Tax=Sulfurimonas sp. TaxID=2022749 RepID=UPI0025FA12CC|nr:AraC family transcriptional regulator [Sulfurimonas sp.]